MHKVSNNVSVYFKNLCVSAALKLLIFRYFSNDSGPVRSSLFSPVL